MRKNLIRPELEKASPAEQGWLDLDNLAQVEISSEDEAYPIESALTATGGEGWKAAQPGEQVIILNFDKPIDICRIHLLFRESEQARTQQFLLRYMHTGDQSYRELVRQEYNFSPPTTTEESEDYTVEIYHVTALELKIIPDISGREAYASLAKLRLS